MLILAGQFLIWALSGLYMVVFDIHYIHGNSLVKEHHKSLSTNNIKYSVDSLSQNFPNFENLELSFWMDKPVYRFIFNEEKQLVDAISGQILPSLKEEVAIETAKYYYTGSGDVTSSKLIIEKPPFELSSRHLPAWQIKFADLGSPTFYISEKDGKLVTKRHDFWRIFDWMFSFHVMDFKEEDVSNKLLFVFTVLSIIAVTAGAVLTGFRFLKERTPTQANVSVFKSLHKWLSLIIGIQIIIWVGTGLYFNLMDSSKASGNQFRTKLETPIISTNGLISAETIVAKHSLIESVELKTLLDKPIYLVTHEKALYKHFQNDYSIVDAKTGVVIELEEKLAEKIAKLSYSGNGDVISVEFINAGEGEILKEKNSLWRVSFDDSVNTSVYIDAGSGRIAGHVDDDKRLADIMFMLHFMDYAQKGSFNNLQNIILATLTLFFVMTGMLWLVELFKIGQLNILFWGSSKRLNIVCDKTNESFSLVSHVNASLLSVAAKEGIRIPSTCGGGGTCGTCKIKPIETLKVMPTEKYMLSEEELQQGYRLACQHKISETQSITVNRLSKST